MAERILIIDDDIAIGTALRVRLEAAGYVVNRTSTGLEGLEQARLARPAAIILDVRMPGMNGFEVNRAMKAEPDLAAIPVIFLSANVVDTTREQALAAGAVAFLCKPYEPADVLAALRAALETTTCGTSSETRETSP